MVRLLNLEDLVGSQQTGAQPIDITALAADIAVDKSVNSNLNSFSAALCCYPIASQLSRYLDLNTLHELSRTCRQIRAELLQNRRLLIAHTLRCENEDVKPGQQLGDALRQSREMWSSLGRAGISFGRVTSGKVGVCARDLVGECRRCSRIVCRNCVIKNPLPPNLLLRHRRLCHTCMKAPLEQLTTSWLRGEDDDDRIQESQHRSAVARSPCMCHEGPWICRRCGLASHAADTTYTRGWKWRTRYSTCGGLGAGLGEGNEGVECGRGEDCLAARLVEKETECDAAELAALDEETAKAEMIGRHWQGSSYATQETVGIGGRVVRKVRRLLPVGAIVKEYEDERITEQFLEREQRGSNRSWCSWCERVIMSDDDHRRQHANLNALAPLGHQLAFNCTLDTAHGATSCE